MKIHFTVDTVTGEVTCLKVPTADQCEDCKENNPFMRLDEDCSCDECIRRRIEEKEYSLRQHDEDCDCDECRKLRGEFDEELKLPF